MWIDASGHVGAQDVASVAIKPDRLVYCCERGSHFVLAYRLYEWKKAVEADPPAIAAKLEQLAELGDVGLTPHRVAVDRALAAVAAVNKIMTGSSDELLELNAAFKAARKVDPSIKKVDYLEARKAAMLEALAGGRKPLTIIVLWGSRLLPRATLPVENCASLSNNWKR